MRKRHLTLLLFPWISVLAGCSTTTAQPPVNTPSMAAVYQSAMNDSETNHIENVRRGLPRAKLTQPVEKISGSTFYKVPNPVIPLYIPAHLAGPDEAPIPSYITAFELYKSDHFALPGETEVPE